MPRFLIRVIAVVLIAVLTADSVMSSGAMATLVTPRHLTCSALLVGDAFETQSIVQSGQFAHATLQKPLVLRKFRRWIESAPGFLDQHRRLVVGVFTALYFLGSLAKTYIKPLWYDELFTFYISKLPTIGDVFQALRVGTDVTPPLFNLISRWSMQVFGYTEFGVRAPAILGLWVFPVSIYHFVRRQTPQSAAGYAALALILPSLTFARTYATEARPYGLLLGFCGLALYFWQGASYSPRRKWMLLGLALSLLGSLSVHYYGALLAWPLMVGEAVKSRQRKRLDPLTWAALLAPLVSLVGYGAFIRTAVSYSAVPLAPTLRLFAEAYYDLLLPPFMLILALVTAIGMYLGKVPIPLKDSEADWHVPEHEIAALGAFFSLPLLIFVFTRLTHVMLTTRYSIDAVAGLIVLAIWMAARAHRNWKTVASVSLMLMISSFSLWQGRNVYLGLRTAPFPELTALTEFAALPAGSGSIYISDSFLFFQMWHYSPPGIKERLRLIYDEPDEGLELLGKSIGFHTQSLSDVTARGRFIVFENITDFKIGHQAGAQAAVLGRKGDFVLMEVQLPAANPARPASSKMGSAA